MSTYQLYKKEHVSIALNVDDRSFLTEKYQLVEQGFERVGDVVKAKDKSAALKHINQVNLDSLREFSTSHLVVVCVTVLIALRMYFHYL